MSDPGVFGQLAAGQTITGGVRLHPLAELAHADAVMHDAFQRGSQHANPIASLPKTRGDPFGLGAFGGGVYDHRPAGTFDENAVGAA